MLDIDRTLLASERFWETQALPTLSEYLRIPNLSQIFDPQWQATGAMHRAAMLFQNWLESNRTSPYLLSEIIQHPGRTPLLLVEIPGTTGGNVLIYGHLDKQPPFTGWREGLDPWQPTREGDRLYGRGAADDGYALFAAIGALKLLAEQNQPQPRCTILIEAGEESGSPDLPFYLERLASKIGKPGLIVCLDSGCATYDRLWLTTSLRGLITGTLRADVLTEGVHSGDSSGIVPSSSGILRHLMSRVEDPVSGAITLKELYTNIPPERRRQAELVATVLGEKLYTRFPFINPQDDRILDLPELILNRTWRPTLCTIGGEGLPPLASAGNVLRPYTAEKLSLRIPPTVKASAAAQALKQRLEERPPWGSRTSFTVEKVATGWHAPLLAPWLANSLNEASLAFFGRTMMQLGEGATIPFAGLLADEFPEAQFLVTGVLGPESNAHGPNEFLHLPAVKRLTACLANVLTDFAQQHLRH